MEQNLTNEKNKLELYLNDVYEKECLFQIETEEVEFIQTGIETLARTAVDLLHEYFDEQKQKSISSGDSSRFYTFLELRDKSNCPRDLIKVGSFYEGTKNKFPNEFDFIFLLFYTESSLYFSTGELNIPQYGTFRDHLMGATLFFKLVCKKNRGKFQYFSSDKRRKLYIDEFVDIHGPAANFRFIYENGSGEKKEINVDFVPGIKVTGRKLPETLHEVCPLKEFHTEILSTGGYLFVGSGGQGVTFTETEVYFMKTILSKSHVKVYRILKFLINGHGDGEKVEEFLQTQQRENDRIYSSYMIKSTMIYHHYQCTCTDTTDIGPCLLQILAKMGSYSTVQDFPQIVYKSTPIQFSTMLTSFKTDAGETDKISQIIVGNENLKFPLPLLPYLQSMTNHLKLMQTSETEYDYEADKMEESVSKMFLDDHTALELAMNEKVQPSDPDDTGDQSATPKQSAESIESQSIGIGGVILYERVTGPDKMSE